MFDKYIIRPICHMISHDLFEFSGYISYAVLLSFFPFVILIARIASFLGVNDLTNRLLADIYTVLPHQIAEQIVPVAKQLTANSNDSLVTSSVIITLWAAASGIEAIRTALNKVHEVSGQRPLYVRISQNILFMLLSIFGIFSISTFLVLLPISVKYLVTSCSYICELIHFKYYASYIVIVLTFSLMYRFLPCKNLLYRYCMPGSLIAGLLWVLLVYVFSLYLNYFASYNTLYGSLAGIMVTLIFLQISAFIMLYGAELNVIIARDKNTV